MINNSPLFPGENDIDQLACVFRVLGTPTPETWPDVGGLPDYSKITFEDMPAVPLEDVVANTTESAIDLLRKMIVLNASKRVTAHAALLHEYGASLQRLSKQCTHMRKTCGPFRYFFCEPLPAHHSELPVPAPKQSSEMDEQPHVGGFKPREMIDPADLPL